MSVVLETGPSPPEVKQEVIKYKIYLYLALA